MEKEVGHKIPSIDKELLTILSRWEREGSVFFKSVVPGKLAMLQWKVTHNKDIWIAQIDIDGRKKT